MIAIMLAAAISQPLSYETPKATPQDVGKARSPLVYGPESARTRSRVIDVRPSKTVRYSPDDILGWVAGDLGQIPQTVRPFIRYIAIPPTAAADWDRAVSLILNEAVSQSPGISTPVSIANGHLLRVDLRSYFSTKFDEGPTGETGAQRLLRIWTEIAIRDGRFYERIDGQIIKVRPYRHSDGKVYSAIRAFAFASWLDPTRVGALTALGVNVPWVVSADAFSTLAFTTTNTPYGKGRYYDLIGAPTVGTNQRDVVFASLGASLARSEQLDAQRRAGLIKSRVTGLDRIIARGQGVSGYYFITLDRGRNEGRQLSTFNQLLRQSHVAEEIFLQRSNGLHIMLASGANGELQTSVPDDVATSDRGGSQDRRISPGFRCWVCHGRYDRDTDNGMIDFPNDVAEILSGNPPIIDDRSDPRLDAAQATNKLRGQYGRAAQLKYDVLNARATYRLAVRQATDINRNGGGFDPAQMHSVLESIWIRVMDSLVTPEQVVREFGYPEGTKFNDVWVDPPGVQFQDLNVRALHQGRAIPFEDFLFAYPNLASTRRRN